MAYSLLPVINVGFKGASMTSKRSDSATGRPLDEFIPGDRIRITAGEFAGLTGVVKKLARADNVLSVDGWPDGIYLIVTNKALARLAPDEHDSS
jgi:KOW motif-containing protein